MPAAWISLTIAAAFLQNVRSSLQVALKGRLSNAGASYVRFLFGLPPALLFLALAQRLAGAPLPEPDATFFVHACVGGLAQILGTVCLLMAATLRNFAVATAYSKTEPILAALFGVVLLAEPVGSAATLGIAVSVGGVIGMGFARSTGSVEAPSRLAWLLDRGGLLGIGCGALFGLAAVSYRGASLALVVPSGDPGGFGFLLRSTTTLAFVLLFQTLVGGVYLAAREPGELRRVLAAWRPAALVGLSGAAASVGWFSAMTLQNAAYVRTLGQVELLFALASSRFFLGDRLSRGELLGIAVLLLGLVLLLALR